MPNPRCHLRVLRVSFRDTLLTWSFTDSVSTFRWPKPSSRRPSIRSGLLSWGCQRSPPSNATLPVHSCQFQVSKDLFPASATACQSRHSFRSCRSSRLQRFPPGGASRACCIPQPIMGFTTFPVYFSRVQRQGSAQSGPSPLTAAFAASPARRPILAAASDWPFPKEPVECYKNSPSEPSSLHPKMSRPLPWTSYPTPKDRIRLCARRLPESGLRMLPRLVPPNPKVLLHRCGTCGLSTIPNGASTLRSFPLNSS